MATLATDLFRMIVRAFYSVEHILVIDALIRHSTLPDSDLAAVLGMQSKPLRKLCGKLREDGLLSVQARGEKRTDGSGSYYTTGPGQPVKERVTMKDWYYINYHKAIDAIKYRLHRLNKHVEGLGAPTTEKKDLICPRCKSTYTVLEAQDKQDMATGIFYCHRCNHALDDVEEEERVNENESMKRLNSQLGKILQLMQQIDATTVPENDFETAKRNHLPIKRSETNPGARTEVVDLPNQNLQSSKGLDIKPEKIAVLLQNDEDVKREAEAAEAQARKEKEARQNALPEWIARSTLTGDVTTSGAKEERQRLEREIHSVGAKTEDDNDSKKVTTGDDDVMAQYWAEMEIEKQKQAEKDRAEEEDDNDEEDDDDDDEFEDVDVTGTGNGTPAQSATRHANRGMSSAVSTPALESSNATDDERETKRSRTEDSSFTGGGSVAAAGPISQDTPASDADDDDDLEFENV